MQKNQLGMSMIELTVAGAAAIGIALGGAQLFKSQNSNQKTVEANYEVATNLQHIRGLLNDPANCSFSFQGKRPEMNPATELGSIRDLKKKINGVFEPVYAVNEKLPGNVMIKSYILQKNEASLASDETMLNIVFSRGKAAIKELVDKKIKITYTLSPSGDILGCSAVSTNSEIWQRSTVTPSSIYYTDGNVGVGTTEPGGLFSVGDGSGAFRVSNEGDLDVSGGADGRWVLSHNSTPKTAFESDGSIQLSGSVRLNSEIKIGNSGVGCTSTTEGSLRYDYGSHAMQFCNGTAWTNFGGGPGTVAVHRVSFPQAIRTSLGCYTFCALGHAHDCNTCGWEVYPMGGACAPGKVNWYGDSNRGSGTANCINLDP